MRFMGWLSKMIISTIVITAISLMVSWFMINMYVDKLFSQMNISDETHKIHLSDFLVQASTQWNNLEVGKQKADDNNTSEAPQATSEAAPDGALPAWSPIYGYNDQGSDKAAGQGLDQGTGQAAGQGAVQDTGQGTGQNTQGTGQDTQQGTGQVAGQGIGEDSYQAIDQSFDQGQSELKGNEIMMSTEDFNNKKNQLTSEEKLEVFSILINRLPQKEMQQISQYIEDGITADELTKAEAIVEKYVDEADYKRLLEILKKY